MKNTRKGIRIVFNSPVVLTFVLLCFCVTLLNEYTGGRSNQLLFITYHSSLKDPLTYVRFFTHVFGQFLVHEVTSPWMLSALQLETMLNDVLPSYISDLSVH